MCHLVHGLETSSKKKVYLHVEASFSTNDNCDFGYKSHETMLIALPSVFKPFCCSLEGTRTPKPSRGRLTFFLLKVVITTDTGKYVTCMPTWKRRMFLFNWKSKTQLCNQQKTGSRHGMKPIGHW